MCFILPVDDLTGFFRLDRKAGASSCYYVLWRCGGHGWVASFHVNIRIRFGGIGWISEMLVIELSSILYNCKSSCTPYCIVLGTALYSVVDNRSWRVSPDYLSPPLDHLDWPSTGSWTSCNMLSFQSWILCVLYSRFLL